MKVFSQLIEAQIESRATDPATDKRGQIWLNTSSNFLKVRLGSTTDQVVFENLSQTLIAKIISAANNTIVTAASGNLTSTQLNPALAELQSDIDTRALILNGTLTNPTITTPTITGGTQTNTTLANPTLSTVINFTDITTPAAPAAGLTRLYTKAGKLYKITSTSPEQQVGSGSGGGGSLRFFAPSGIGAILDEEFGAEVYKFSTTVDGVNFSTLRVRLKLSSAFTNFTNGQAKIYFDYYTPSTTGRVRYQSVTTLIRNGVDAITTTTNQRTDTVETINSAPANLPRLVTLTLTDSSGLINGVAPVAHDILWIEIKRIAATTAEDAEDSRFMAGSAELDI